MVFNPTHELASSHFDQPLALAGEVGHGSALVQGLGNVALPHYYSSASEGAALQAFGPEDGSGREPIGIGGVIAAANDMQPPRLAARKTPEQIAAEARSQHGPADLTPPGDRNVEQEQQTLRAVQQGAGRANRQTQQTRPSQS